MSETKPFEPISPEKALAIGYERSEPDAAQIGALTVVIVISILLSGYAVYYWYVGQLEYTRHMEVEIPIWQELKDVRAAETERLTQYKYIDKTKGSVQLPIERSMELLIKEAEAGKVFYSGVNSAIKPREEDAGLQAVLDKALGKIPTPPPPPASSPVAGDVKTPAPEKK